MPSGKNRKARSRGSVVTMDIPEEGGEAHPDVVLPASRWDECDLVWGLGLRVQGLGFKAQG